MGDSKSDLDLPLMANTNDILIEHYLFYLNCDFKQKVFKGSVVINFGPGFKSNFCVCDELASSRNGKSSTYQSNENNDHMTAFTCVLDCSQIIVEKVVELHATVQGYKFINTNLDNFEEVSELKFTLDKWSIKIWKPEVFCCCLFPKLICIHYQTMSDGKSLMWVKDQDLNQCVYTYGAWINNRSLFPCQEPPSAMATWEAQISVKESNAVVLMSGDNQPLIIKTNGFVTYYFYTEMKLPMSTLALAVGFWQTKEVARCGKEKNVLIRICAPLSLIDRANEDFSEYILSCIDAAEYFFGPYPFPKIDFLIVPRGFCSLGMASPNIIFLSQSLLSGDKSMCCRIAHEIAHTWFGLLIGASDWSEEWLSEGFATFAEDFIHAKAVGMKEDDKRDYFEMKSNTRAKTLIAEVENTEEELHVLRPNKGKAVTEIIDGVEAVILKNGQNPEKCFMQVHYIKGFFLLKYLSDFVGESSFLEFLKRYIGEYKGQLVDSTEMLNMYFQEFPQLSAKQITIEKIVENWLHTSAIPKAILEVKPSVSNKIYNIAKQEAVKWKKFNSKCSNKRNAKRTRYDLSSFLKVTSDELSVMLDFLLEIEKIPSQILNQINLFYAMQKLNAEVRHKWCELIVKHRFYQEYNCLKNFLVNDLAMGVYLYGEMLLNGTNAQRVFATECFNEAKCDMELNTITTIKHMLESAETVQRQH